MSDENPFIVWNAEIQTVQLDGKDITHMGEEEAVMALNAAVAVRERKAAAKALRTLADEYANARDKKSATRLCDVAGYIRSRADAVEKGEA